MYTKKLYFPVKVLNNAFQLLKQIYLKFISNQSYEDIHIFTNLFHIAVFGKFLSYSCSQTTLPA